MEDSVSQLKTNSTSDPPKVEAGNAAAQKQGPVSEVPGKKELTFALKGEIMEAALKFLFPDSKFETSFWTDAEKTYLEFSSNDLLTKVSNFQKVTHFLCFLIQVLFSLTQISHCRFKKTVVGIIGNT